MIQHFNILKRALLLLGIFSSLAQPAYAVEIGESAPIAQWQTDTGKIDIAQLKGQVVLLDFWASWCGPCRASFPWMNEMQAKYASKGLKVLAVNLDSNSEDARKFLQQVPAQFQVAYDKQGDSPRLFKVKGMPTSYIIDRQGKVTQIHSGFNTSQKENLEKQLLMVLEK